MVLVPNATFAESMHAIGALFERDCFEEDLLGPPKALFANGACNWEFGSVGDGVYDSLSVSSSSFNDIEQLWDSSVETTRLLKRVEVSKILEDAILANMKVAQEAGHIHLDTWLFPTVVPEHHSSPLHYLVTNGFLSILNWAHEQLRTTMVFSAATSSPTCRRMRQAFKLTDECCGRTVLDLAISMADTHPEYLHTVQNIASICDLNSVDEQHTAQHPGGDRADSTGNIASNRLLCSDGRKSGWEQFASDETLETTPASRCDITQLYSWPTSEELQVGRVALHGRFGCQVIAEWLRYVCAQDILRRGEPVVIRGAGSLQHVVSMPRTAFLAYPLTVLLDLTFVVDEALSMNKSVLEFDNFLQQFGNAPLSVGTQLSLMLVGTSNRLLSEPRCMCRADPTCGLAPFTTARSPRSSVNGAARVCAAAFCRTQEQFFGLAEGTYALPV